MLRGKNAAVRWLHSAVRRCNATPVGLPPPVLAAASAPSKLRLTVGPHDGNMRLDRWLRMHRVNAPVSLIEKLVRGRHIQIVKTEQEATMVPESKEATVSPPAKEKLSGRYRVQAGQQLLVPAWLINGGSSDAAVSSSASSPSQPPSERAALTVSELSDLRSRVLHSDEHLVVFNKPAGLAVHGGSAQQSARNLNAMLWALEAAPMTATAVTADAAARSSAASPAAASVASSGLRLVHRLDKETSGCLMLARDRHTAEMLSDLLAAPSSSSSASTSTAAPTYSAAVWNDAPSSATVTELVQKRYLAIVHGVPSQPEGALVSAAENGTLCHSSYRVLAVSGGTGAAAAAFSAGSFDRFSLLELIPHTGRKRQLRLHCHHELGCTLVGEQLYMLGVPAAAAAAMDRNRSARDAVVRQALGWAASSRALPLCLHAHQLVLRHPLIQAGQTLRVRAPLPPPFAKLCSSLFPGWTPPASSSAVRR